MTDIQSKVIRAARCKFSDINTARLICGWKQAKRWITIIVHIFVGQIVGCKKIKRKDSSRSISNIIAVIHAECENEVSRLLTFQELFNVGLDTADA